MKNSLRRYMITVIVVLVVSAALFVFLYATLDQSARVDVRIEVLKVLLQLAAIGVIGGFITWILNERSKEKEREAVRQQKRAERQDALNDFRRNAVARVVVATNVVRSCPVLIESHQSKKTYGEQIRAVLDARLDLSLVRHEQQSSNAFTKPLEIDAEISKMEDYLNWIVTEWKDHYKNLPVPPLDAWDAIRELPALKDLRKGDETSRFYKEYLVCYREALRLMRADIFNPTDDNDLRPA